MPENSREHLYIKNDVGESRIFHLDRGMDKKNRDDTEIDKHFRSQKDRLYTNYQIFINEQKTRHQNRNLVLPAHIDYIKISFLKIFNPDLARKYDRSFGLRAVSFSNLNQDVIFAISDNRRFKENFVRLLNLFYNSRGDEVPGECKDLIIIHQFYCLTSERILPYRISENLILRLVDNSLISHDFNIIRNELIHFLRVHDISYDEIAPDSLFQISFIPEEVLKILIDNFDIVQNVQSLRTLRIRPDTFGDPELVMGLNVSIEPNAPVIGIIDTGISSADFMSAITCKDGIDLTNPDNPRPYSVEVDHGTTVATLASFGWDYFNNKSDYLQADAKVFSIKAQSGETTLINLFKIAEAIKKAHIEYGIRIFNLSLNIGSKEYNAGISEYAYLLDELAYRYDILIFISTGNLSLDDINEIERVRQDASTDPAISNFLSYPNHFYNPNKESEVHECVCSNLCEPSESMNNMTVGALAGNFIDDGDLTGLSLDKKLPAFYTRKYYIDHTKRINNTRFKKNQINKNIFKPDIVMPGGDVLSSSSKMQVIGYDSGTFYYKRSSGTSYATPLAANLAAKIINKYPQLKMQTVKALIINSSIAVNSTYLDNLILDLKQESSSLPLNQLSKSQKSALSNKYSAGRLNKYDTSPLP